MKETIAVVLSGIIIGATAGLTSRWIYSYYKEHKCDNPYTQVCVKSHMSVRMVPFYNGKTTIMRPMPRRICDEYENVLKEYCHENKAD